MKNVILIAPPAAGKGTVSQILKEKYGYNHLSAGDALRDEIKSGSELGSSIKNIVESGRLVDHTMLKELMKSKIKSLGLEKPYVFDGYPRDIAQATDFSDICEELNIEHGKVYFLDVDEKTAIYRTLGRLVCPICKISYNKNTENYKPKEEGICDICKSKLEQRADDNEETFKNRFENFLNETKPLIDFYKEKGNLIIIDAEKEAEDIVNEIILTLGES